MISLYIPPSKRMTRHEVLAVLRKLYPVIRKKGSGDDSISILAEGTYEHIEINKWMANQEIDESSFRAQLECIFKTDISTQSWEQLLSENSPIGDICKLVSQSGAFRQPILPLKVAKTNCLLAGIFMAVRSSLQDVGLPVTRYRPSSTLGRLSSQDMGSITIALAKLVPSVILTPVPSGWENVGRWSFQGIATIGDLCREIAKEYESAVLEPTDSGELQLTNRELQVIRLLSLGLTNKAMAKELNVSTETIKTHMKHIMTKMSATGRTEVLVKAIESGLVCL